MGNYSYKVTGPDTLTLYTELYYLFIQVMRSYCSLRLLKSSFVIELSPSIVIVIGSSQNFLLWPQSFQCLWKNVVFFTYFWCYLGRRLTYSAFLVNLPVIINFSTSVRLKRTIPHDIWIIGVRQMTSMIRLNIRDQVFCLARGSNQRPLCYKSDTPFLELRGRTYLSKWDNYRWYQLLL
jgi:hypothetical protein